MARINARTLAQELLPPVLFRAMRRFRTSIGGSARTQGSEQNAQWYDEAFHANEGWRAHYSESHYYPLWTVIAERIRQAHAASVLDIGCGPGQMACLLRDRGVARYLGLDFSAERIACAKHVCPQFEFIVADAFETDVFDEHEYDIVVCTEFLEHVEGDLELLARLPKGVPFLGTVPNFPYASHVRHFDNAGQVMERYSSRLGSLEIDAFPADAGGRTYFIIDGRLL